MSDHIILNDALSLIEIDSSGIVLRNDIQRSIEEVKQHHSRIGINKVLVDTTKQDKLPTTFDIFEIFSTSPRGIKLRYWSTKASQHPAI